jgi:ABC-2 type transport system ATP-binding protein
VLKLRNINKAYGEVTVLKDLSIDISRGEIYGLLGPNGAGKTTAISIICHLLNPDSGLVLVDGELSTKNIKPLIGIVPQENLLYKSLTCEENLQFFATLYGLWGREREQRVYKCLRAVGLKDRAKSPAESLSGGMLRRLNLAIALVHQPKLLILDEPTTGLDIEARFDLWNLIRQLQQQGMTILLTTHLLEEAERLCDRIGILKRGCLLAEGTLAQLRKCIPANEVVLIQTTEPEKAIARGRSHGLIHRRYGTDLGFWISETRSLQELISLFDGIPLDSISRRPISLEDLYIEITQGNHTPSEPQPPRMPVALTYGVHEGNGLEHRSLAPSQD